MYVCMDIYVFSWYRLPMNNVVIVQVLQRFQHLNHIAACFLLTQAGLLHHPLMQVPATHVLQDKIEAIRLIEKFNFSYLKEMAALLERLKMSV